MQNSCYAVVNLVTDLSGNKEDFSEDSKGHVPELWLVDSDPFFWFLLLDVRYSNDWRCIKSNRKLGFEL